MRNQRYTSFFLLLALLFAACGETTTTGNGGGAGDSTVAVPPPQATLDQPFKLVVQAAAQQPVGMPGLHSAAFGESNGKWLFIGGRTNGFHTMFGPDRLFPQTTANDKIWVIDRAAGKTYNLPLPKDWNLRSNLMANNMAYVQVGNLLYFVGGYGSEKATGSSDYTFKTCIGIDVPAMIAAVIANNGDQAKAAVKFVLENDALQVTGGEMETLGGDLYLLFGQNYGHTYNGQNGDYTQSILRFRVDMAPTPTLKIIDTYHYGPQTPNEFHRRDLNALHGVVDKKEAIIAWSGVFTESQGAWPNPILVSPGANKVLDWKVDRNFSQKANLYKSGAVIQYDSTTGVLYTSMLGGITNYFYDPKTKTVVPSDVLPPAEQLPFSNLINTIVRMPDGQCKEYIQSGADGMPGYLGANAQFISATEGPYFHEIILYNPRKDTGRTLIGWMVGGIVSTGPQSGNGVTTKSNNVLYEVYRAPIAK